MPVQHGLHGRPLRYDVEQIGHRAGMIASNGRVHEAAIARLAPLFESMK